MTKKMFFIVSLVGLILVGGAGFGYYTMKMNANSFKGTAIPTKGLKDELCEEWAKAFEESLGKEEVLKAIVEKSDYASALGVPPGEAVAHLKDAIKVRFVKRKDSIEIGLLGKRKQDEALIKISPILYQEARDDVRANVPSFQQFLEIVSKNASEQSQ